MANNVRDLAEWYPFMPPYVQAGTAYTVPDIVYNVLDAYIRIQMDASDEPYASRDVNVNAFGSCVMREITGNTAIVRCYGPMFDNGYEDMEVDVLTGRDSMGTPEKSYIVLDHAQNFTGELQIHPDCLDFIQRAPNVKFWHRGDVDYNDVVVSPHVLYEPADGVPIIVNGHNVEASYSVDNGLVFTGAAGAGKGIYMVPPYVNPGMVYDEHAGVGLRSINGATDVIIEGDGVSVSVTTSVDQDPAHQNIIVYVEPIYEDGSNV